MNWYIAKIVFQVINGNRRHAPQFDEQLRLIAACNNTEAYDKACAKGKGEEEVFYNTRNEQVRWVFVNVTELLEVGELSDGMELYASTAEVEDEKEYLQQATLRSSALQSKVSPIFATLV